MVKSSLLYFNITICVKEFFPVYPSWSFLETFSSPDKSYFSVDPLSTVSIIADQRSEIYLFGSELLNIDEIDRKNNLLNSPSPSFLL